LASHVPVNNATIIADRRIPVVFIRCMTLPWLFGDFDN